MAGVQFIKDIEDTVINYGTDKFMTSKFITPTVCIISAKKIPHIVIFCHIEIILCHFEGYRDIKSINR